MEHSTKIKDNLQTGYIPNTYIPEFWLAARREEEAVLALQTQKEEERAAERKRNRIKLLRVITLTSIILLTIAGLLMLIMASYYVMNTYLVTNWSSFLNWVGICIGACLTMLGIGTRKEPLIVSGVGIIMISLALPILSTFAQLLN
jgi:hypothetical protein